MGQVFFIKSLHHKITQPQPVLRVPAPSPRPALLRFLLFGKIRSKRPEPPARVMERGGHGGHGGHEAQPGPMVGKVVNGDPLPFTSIRSYSIESPRPGGPWHGHLFPMTGLQELRTEGVGCESQSSPPGLRRPAPDFSRASSCSVPRWSGT